MAITLSSSQHNSFLATDETIPTQQLNLFQQNIKSNSVKKDIK